MISNCAFKLNELLCLQQIRVVTLSQQRKLPEPVQYESKGCVGFYHMPSKMKLTIMFLLMSVCAAELLANYLMDHRKS